MIIASVSCVTIPRRPFTICFIPHFHRQWLKIADKFTHDVYMRVYIDMSAYIVIYMMHYARMYVYITQDFQLVKLIEY